MILEIAELDIKEGMEAEFEHGVEQAIPIFKVAKGFISLKLRRIVERPLSYRLFVEWQTLEDHTETFRNSEGFQTWRNLVGHCFAGAPRVDHSVIVHAAVSQAYPSIP